MSRDRSVYLRHMADLLERVRMASTTSPRACPQLPWAQIAGFRNVLAHQYLGVDIGLVWGIIVRDLPALERELASMLRGE